MGGVPAWTSSSGAAQPVRLRPFRACLNGHSPSRVKTLALLLCHELQSVQSVHKKAARIEVSRR